MKVDFIIVGAQKCATTTLFEILSGHPSIVGARGKEPHFFSMSPDWKRELPAYEALFEQREGALYCEASTSYTFYPHRNLEIWNDLAAYNPEMKLIYMVRDPVDRIVSSYMHNVARGYTRDPIEKVVRRHSLYRDASRYYAQIIPFIRTFGRDRVLLIDFDDFVGDRHRTLREVTRFLGVSFDRLPRFERIHANPSAGQRGRHHWFDSPPRALRVVRSFMPGVWNRVVNRFSPALIERPQLSPAFRRTIINTLELEILALEELMGKDLAAWRGEEASDGNGPIDAFVQPAARRADAMCGVTKTPGGEGNRRRETLHAGSRAVSGAAPARRGAGT